MSLARTLLYLLLEHPALLCPTCGSVVVPTMGQLDVSSGRMETAVYECTARCEFKRTVRLTSEQ